MSLNLFSIILLVGIMQGIIMIFWIIIGKPAQTYRKLLIVALLLVYTQHNLRMFIKVAFPNNYWDNTLFDFIHYSSATSTMFVAFLFYLITQNITSIKYNKKYTLLIFSPIAFAFIYYTLRNLTIYINNNNLGIYQQIYFQIHSIIYSLIKFISPIITFICLYFSFKMVEKYRIKIKENFADIDRIKLHSHRLLLILLISFFGIWVIIVILDFVMFGLGIANKQVTLGRMEIYTYISLLYVLLTYWTSNSNYFFLEKHLQILQSTKPEKGEKKKTEVHKNYTNAIYTVKSIMQKSELFLDPQLNLYKLAKEVKMTPREVTETLNEGLKKNFYDFVNEYRVEDVKKKLLSKKFEHLSILGIAYDSGFNTKSAFNRVFKQHTQLTPSEYKKKNKEINS